MEEDRYERGWETLNELDPSAGDLLVAGLKDIAPDMARYVIESAFGDVLSRPGLDVRSREIATVAALTAMGTAGPQLRSHIGFGLNVGLSREEVVEIMMQMALYAGIPAALNGLIAAAEVFALRDATSEPPPA